MSTETEKLIEEFEKATSFKYQEYSGANYSIFKHNEEQLNACAAICIQKSKNGRRKNSN